MPPILGNLIVTLAVAALVFVCARYLYRDAKRGGGCAGCGGSCSGSCGSCAAPCAVDESAVRAAAARIDVERLRKPR